MVKIFAFLFFGILAFPVGAQVRNAYSVEHEIYDIDSKYVNETRQILVHVPLSYRNSNKRYPVVYMLDGHTPHPEMMAGILANQAWGDAIPEMILVSIRNTDRTRDMTPTRVERFPTSGGIEEFLDFIEKEVIPLVEEKYRVEPYRIFAGHSFAGLAVVYTLVNRPAVFQAYIAASPYLQWDDELVIKQAAKNFRNAGLKKTIFLGLGDEPDYLKAWNSFQSVLKKSKPKGLVYEFTQFKDESHGSGVLPAYFQGLRFIFRGWALRGQINPASISAHYDDLTKRFGFKVIPPEDYLNAAGYFLMRENKYTEALAALNENAGYYPESANVYDSLGECLEKMGRFREALENYETSVRLAVKAGNEPLARSARLNRDRVKATLEK